MSTGDATIYVGAVSPAACVFVVTDADTNLAAVTTASLEVLRPDNGEVTWLAAHSFNSTTGELTVTHAFGPGEVDLPGTYRIFAQLTTPDGMVRSKTRSFVAKTKFDPTL